MPRGRIAWQPLVCPETRHGNERTGHPRTIDIYKYMPTIINKHKQMSFKYPHARRFSESGSMIMATTHQGKIHKAQDGQDLKNPFITFQYRSLGAPTQLTGISKTCVRILLLKYHQWLADYGSFLTTKRIQKESKGHILPGTLSHSWAWLKS